MNNKHTRQRIRIMEIICIIGCIGFIAIFGGKYLVMTSMSKRYKATKDNITYKAIQDYVIEGNVVDTNNNIISGYSSSGNRSYVEYPNSYSYAWLLGYYNVQNEQENTYGLLGNLSDYLLYTLDDNNQGATVYLTTNNNLQNYAYNLLNGDEGSITVLDNETGAILCLTSQSTIEYDVNDSLSMINSNVDGAQYRRGTYENDPPGSTFKVLTSAAAFIKQEEENLPNSFFDYYDEGEYIPEGSDFTITNYGNYTYGQVGIEEALSKSINTYFAQLGNKIGQERLESIADTFYIGHDIEIPFLDTIHSSIDCGSGQPKEIAQIAFGQGNTQITPFHLALICQALGNNGKMMSPYIVKDIKGKLPYYHFFPHKLTDTIDESILNKVKTIMHTTAVAYGFDEDKYGMVYAKTGTAECSNDRIHTYLMGFTDKYSFCISKNNSDHSYNLYPIALDLVNYLNNM